jgi:hypothetical protein
MAKLPELKLHPETLAFLEARGAPAVRALMDKLPKARAAAPEAHAVVEQALEADYVLVSITRADAEAWLRWKATKKGRTAQRGNWAVILAAITGVVGLLLQLLQIIGE